MSAQRDKKVAIGALFPYRTLVVGRTIGGVGGQRQPIQQQGGQMRRFGAPPCGANCVRHSCVQYQFTS